jgi:hypothetical protein
MFGVSMEKKNARLGMALHLARGNLSLCPTTALHNPYSCLVPVAQLLYFTPHTPGDRQGVLIVYLD